MEEGNGLTIKIVDEMCIISYFILTHRITQNTIPNTDNKFIQEMPCGQKLHNFSTKGLNQKKALPQFFKAWLCYPYNLPNLQPPQTTNSSFLPITSNKKKAQLKFTLRRKWKARDWFIFLGSDHKKSIDWLIIKLLWQQWTATYQIYSYHALLSLA